MTDNVPNEFKQTGVRMSEELIEHLKIQAIKQKTSFQDHVNQILWDHVENTIPELIEAKNTRIKDAKKEDNKTL